LCRASKENLIMTKYKDIKDEELVELFKYKYTYHSAEAKKYKTFLDMYNSAFKDLDSEIVSTIEPERKADDNNAIQHKSDSKKTFEEVIIEMLNSGKPMTAKMLLNKYSTLGLKEVTLKDFSSKLSMRSKAGHIKNAKFNEYPTDQRFWWGLSDWFDGDNLKDEYVAIVHNYMNSHK
jgi:hypothetical protein